MVKSSLLSIVHSSSVFVFCRGRCFYGLNFSSRSCLPEEKLPKDIGQDPEYDIAVTLGKRAIDNHFQDQEIEAEVENFANTIL